MTSRERLLATLNHRLPDRVPWSSMVNRYFFYSQGEKYSKMDSFSFLKEMGADILSWNKFDARCRNTIVKTSVNNKLIDVDENGPWFNDEYLHDINYKKRGEERVIEKKYITDFGELVTKFTYKPASHTVFITEFPVKCLEDVKIFTKMIENLEYGDLKSFYLKKAHRIGNHGLCAAFLHSTPAYELIQLYMGLERFHYFFYDYIKEMVKLLSIMREKFRQCYNKYSNYKEVDVVMVPEDASTTLYSPKFFDDYIRPVLSEYCETIKNANKIATIHACGHLKGLLEYFRKINFDCLESISPPPTGNVEVSEVKRALPGVCIMGGIPANIFLYKRNEFEDYIKELILNNRAGGNFILSSADSVPADAKIENFKSILKVVDQYGKY